MKLNESPFTNAVPEKELPHSPDGAFQWLRGTPTHDEWAIGDERADEIPSQLDLATAAAKRRDVSLPTTFTMFMADATLHKHLRSANGDYLDLAESLLPFSGGYLLRFLSDQQGCAYWYLFIDAKGADHCVVSSYEYFDADEMDYESEELKESDFLYWANSVEGFFSRYWIEQEMMFSRNDGTPPPNIDPRFLQIDTE